MAVRTLLKGCAGRIGFAKLAGGLRFFHVPRKSNSIVLLVSVRSGSNDETIKIQGISHFIEHLVFDATKNRPGSLQISNEIEKRGGDFNAATSNERTYFYVSILKRHFNVALDVLSDIILNPLFRQLDIDKEKKIIVDEINMINDQPRYFQWILFSKTLYKAAPPGNAVYGRAETVRKMGRKDILGYYRKNYTPSNTDIVLVGGSDSQLELAKRRFSSWKTPAHTRAARVIAPKASLKVVRVKRATNQAYLVLGYSTVPRSHPDSYVLDVIKGHLGRGQSGRIFDVIRTQEGLAYDVGAHHNPSRDYGFFAVYVNTSKKNIIRTKDIILKELEGLKAITNKELEESKTYIEGDFMLQLDDGLKLAESIAYWSAASSVEAFNGYLRNIRSVSVGDVRRAVSKYFLPEKYTFAVIEPDPKTHS